MSYKEPIFQKDSLRVVDVDFKNNKLVVRTMWLAYSADFENLNFEFLTPQLKKIAKEVRLYRNFDSRSFWKMNKLEEGKFSIENIPQSGMLRLSFEIVFEGLDEFSTGWLYDNVIMELSK